MPERPRTAQFAGGILAALILLAFIVVPLVEIAIFIEVGGLIGALPTIGLVVAIALVGTWLLRRQGLGTLAKAQAALNRGEMPVAEVLDGFMLIFAALLMVTPGLLTDAIGLLLLVPALRQGIGRAVARWAMTRSGVGIHGAGPRATGSGPIIDGEAEPVEADKEDADRKPGRVAPWSGGERA